MKVIVTWLLAILFSILFWAMIIIASQLYPLVVLTALGGVTVLVVVSIVSAKVMD